MFFISRIDTDPAMDLAEQLAKRATQALLDEVNLTPKPGLVDQRSSGAHHDLSLDLMEASAHSLSATFYELALVSWQRQADVALRLEIGKIGRAGEQAMMNVTHGVNTHRGAIWALGLLVSSAAMLGGEYERALNITQGAATMASIGDPMQPQSFSKGKCASQRYRIPGAKEQAQLGFPAIINRGLPQLHLSRQHGANESQARVDALLSMMSSLTDTCVLSRGGTDALSAMQRAASLVLDAGGMATIHGQTRFDQLEQIMLTHYISPGGSADLLSATLLLDGLTPTPLTNPN
ncbi:triphosphoribosyl-dephospho-CoA synthase [Celerinatantimonas yamalensis]|uniref:Probable 2-(5''-triphosphoribosyl)-3'-dephosphocoenzyme-A synthase n=1 Tax=Celerinatantimonas yamalensis TaxID=559956 RepID=A0ABW9G6L1_9GAMM